MTFCKALSAKKKAVDKRVDEKDVRKKVEMKKMFSCGTETSIASKIGTKG